MTESLSLPPVPEPPKGERLKNKVVLLTGAAQGIGEAIVATFASQQAKLIISDIQGENCLLYTSPSPRDRQKSRMPSSA